MKKKDSGMQKQSPAHGKAAHFASNKKLHCGGISILLTVFVLIMVILVNCLAQVLEDRYALTVDCSYNEITMQSEVTQSVLASLARDVHIYDISSSSGDSASYLLSDDQISLILSRYAAASGHITWSRESLVQNPTLKDNFRDMLNENEITANCIIVSCPKTKRARVLDDTDFAGISYNVDAGQYELSGYTYEKSLTEAILYVTQDDLPVIQILTGHGELTETDSSVLEDVLTRNNYLTRRVTLGGADVLDADAPLLILCPQLDLTQAELEELLDFAKAGGDFLLVQQYSDNPDLKNLNALLSCYGIAPLPGLCVADSSETDTYFSDSPAILMPYMLPSPVTQTLIDNGKDVLLLAGARAYETSGTISNDLIIYPLLQSGNAYLRQYQDGAEALDRQNSDPSGVFDLALMSTWTQVSGDFSTLFVVGNASLFTDDWVYANTYSAEFLLQILNTLQGRQPVNLAIVQKSAARAPMSYGSLALPTILVLVLPLVVLLCALLILLPRRNL